MRGPGSRAVDSAQGRISPAVSLLRPGGSLVLEVQGVAEPITWQVIGQGYRSHLSLRPASRHQLMMTLAPGSTLDEIVFLRAESQVDGQRSGLASVRLMPEPLPVKEPDPVPVPREPGLLSRLLGFGPPEAAPARR